MTNEDENGTAADESSVHENFNAKDHNQSASLTTNDDDNEKANDEVVVASQVVADGDKDYQAAETIVDDHSSTLRLKISESSSSTIDGIGGEPQEGIEPTVEVEVVETSVSPEPTTTDDIMSTGVVVSASAIVSPVKEEDDEDGMMHQSPTPTQTSSEHDVSMDSDNNKHGYAISGNNQVGSDNTAPLKEDENGMITSPVVSSNDNNANKPDNSHENQDGNSVTNNNKSNKSSSSLGDDLINEEMAKVISEVETSSSVILSDAGETLTSTAPVINMTTSGMNSHDERMVALGVFAKAANADGENEGHYSSSATDAAAGSDHKSIDNNVDIKPTIAASESEAAENSTSTRGVISPINTVPEEAGKNAVDAADISNTPRKSTISALSPSSFNSAGPSSSGGYDKKRLTERLKQRLAKRNHMNSVTSSPTKSVEGDVTAAATAADNPPTPNSSERDESRDRAQWETRLQAASRQKRQFKSRAKSEVSNDGAANSDILSRYSSSSDVGGTASHRKIYPDTVTFSDGEDDDDAGPASLRIDTKIASRDRRTAYRKCVSEVGASLAMSTRSSRSKLSKHHPTHHHGIGILQSDGIVYDDEMLLRLARQARFGRGRGEVSTNSDDDSGRVNEVKIHVYDLLTKDSLVEVPYFNCQFPIGQCFRIVNSGCHSLGTGAYHVGVEINGVEYAFGANNIVGMSGIFTCVPKESPGYEYRKCVHVHVACLLLHMLGLSQFINIILQEKLWILVSSTQQNEPGYVFPSPQTLDPLPSRTFLLYSEIQLTVMIIILIRRVKTLPNLTRHPRRTIIYTPFVK